MSTKLEELQALHGWFSESIRDIFDTAYAIEEPAGDSEAWRKLCEQNGVTAATDDDRRQIRAGQRPLRGAPVMEMVPIVAEVCRQGRVSLRRIDVWEAPQTTKTLHEQLRTLFDRTDAELIGAYKKAVLPKAGGMFAHVTASPSAGRTYDRAAAVALRCMHCGAPRLNDKDFTCAFCGEQMV